MFDQGETEDEELHGTPLRVMVDLRDRTLQKARIAFSNRVLAVQRGTDESNPTTEKILQKWADRFRELEMEADRDIAELTEGIAIIEHMTQLKGIGPLLAAKLVALIDIERAQTVSGLWRFCGYGVVEGGRERPVKGERLHYSVRAKTTCYLIATSFMRANSPYRHVYDDAKTYYTEYRPDWPKARVHMASLRKMIKVFLAHLWNRWRELENLPTRPLYVHEKLGHTTEYHPEDFGWHPLSGPTKKGKRGRG